MLIRITSGTYGHRPMLIQDGRRVPSDYVVPTTRLDPPIDVDETEAKRLVDSGVAEYVHREAVATAPASHGDEGHNGNIPDPEAGQECPGDGENEEDPEGDDDSPAFSTDMKADELRSAMRERGLPIRVGMTKAEMVAALNGSEEEAPYITPEDVVEE